MKSKPTYVFVHGLLGFAEFGFPPLSVEYFRNLKNSLSDISTNIYFPSLPPTSSIKVRAEALSQFIDKIDADNICLIAHSMGGLDSRFYASQLDKKHRIKQIITIATPHHGTPLASWIINKTNILHSILNKIVFPAVTELTIEASQKFNENILDRTDVYYESYAGCRPAHELPLWFPFWSRKLSEISGDNDSQVPVLSAKWGNFAGVLHADHVEFTGWNLGFANKKNERPFNHTLFYRKVLASSMSRF